MTAELKFGQAQKGRYVADIVPEGALAAYILRSDRGTVGALAAISNAVRGALAPLGVRQVDMPFTPLRLWQMIEEARSAA